MAVGELQTSVNWVFWLALSAPPVMLLALLGFVRRWWRSRRLLSQAVAHLDASAVRLNQALTRPRQRRAAMVDRVAGLNASIAPYHRVGSADDEVRRPGLTTRWKGDHRIAIGR